MFYQRWQGWDYIRRRFLISYLCSLHTESLAPKDSEISDFDRSGNFDSTAPKAQRRVTKCAPIGSVGNNSNKGGKGSKGNDLISTKMKTSLSTKMKTMLTHNNQMHPLVQQQVDGLKIYSKSFFSDFWLVYKNKHIFVSCFTAHGEHFYSRSERFWVLFVSLFVAFGLTGITTYFGKLATCASIMVNGAISQGSSMASDLASDPGNINQVSNEASSMGSNTFSAFEACKRAKNIPIMPEFAGVFGLVSSLLQMSYDMFAVLFVTCSCVQTCPIGIKVCCEGVGKFAFAVLAILAMSFLGVGLAMSTSDGLDAGLLLSTFVITKFSNFLFVTSLTLLVTFYMGRKAQMKPSAVVLATEKGKKKWEEPKKGCCSSKPKAACDLWNKHIGADKTFVDLPETAWDYDIDVKVSFCVCCCTRTLYAYKGKNQIPDTRNDPEALILTA